MKKKYFLLDHGAARQFDFKLHNALCITKEYPKSYSFIGVIWVSECVFKVDSRVFGELIGHDPKHLIQSGGLFDRHHFFQMFKTGSPEFVNQRDFGDVDDVVVKLYYDKMCRFSRDKKYHQADSVYDSPVTIIN